MSFPNDFMWAEGYGPRFGLIYVDYVTKQRIIKDSASLDLNRPEYKKIIETKGEGF